MPGTVIVCGGAGVVMRGGVRMAPLIGWSAGGVVEALDVSRA